ncbi:hypothetical protein HG536_0A07190 [Torulaspora globosa]|uniref:Meiosis protein 5 n=1 Tax=Torulaspora globosa TaxID=48254 RepID=A0A7G3ZBL8_9SACH|nr:uncharacterized protein HG536_0A07190 [Torulaspora globosa]QLL30904.1 hypothetical protein HG536_0A07190 [Torulaspora globosa]
MDDTTMVDSSPAGVAEKPYKNKAGDRAACASTSRRSGPRKTVQKRDVSVEDRKLATQTRLLFNELSRQKASYKKHIDQLKQAIKILESFETEERILDLISKWRGVSQAGMSYMLNSTLLKIDKMGGYEELLRRECEAEKRKIEYQFSDNLQEDMEAVFESEDFQALSEEMQQEYREQMMEQVKEAQIRKEKEFAEIELKMKQSAGQEMSMQELSKRMKLEYSMIFPD